MEDSLRTGNLAPRLRLFSGRILDRRNENATGFVENQIAEAVRYFNGEYGCRVFNLSFGDFDKPYQGKHLKGLSYILDTLTRELGVLFVVSAGNVIGSQLDGLAWRQRYPAYLTEPEWAIVEPAPALNVLTVGSLARYDRTFNNQRYAGDALGNAGGPSVIRPSPFTRHGPSVAGAIKPELVPLRRQLGGQRPGGSRPAG
ncbi:MAG: S8 family serine peptidase [Desulfurivibrio sp.]|nr:S8 family serine peptidase [Desulfurivibrio sp.]